MKTLALLDAIIEQEWEYRYFSYDSNWSDTEEVGSLRDGCGGAWFLWMSGELAAYKCLSPEDGLMSDLQAAKDDFPSAYEGFINEPAFSMDDVTNLWYMNDSNWVKYGKTVSQLIDLSAIIKWSANDYHAWATEYYERDIDFSCVEKVFNGHFDQEIAKQLNPNVDMELLQSDLREIDFNPL